jgi:hypothetical protein
MILDASPTTHRKRVILRSNKNVVHNTSVSF